MSDSTGRYWPSLLATGVGGVQWGLSAVLVSAAVVSVYVDYLLATRTPGPGTIGPGPRPILVGGLVGLVTGSLWVGFRTEHTVQEARATRRRVEFVVVLLFGWPLVFLPLVAIEMQLPPLPGQGFVSTLGPPVYAVGGIAFAYLLVYHRGFDRVTNWTKYDDGS